MTTTGIYVFVCMAGLADLLLVDGRAAQLQRERVAGRTIIMASPAAEHPPPDSSSRNSLDEEDTFRYVFIPADDSLPIQEATASKSGGLSHDALLARAREHFALQRHAAASGLPTGGQTVPPGNAAHAPLVDISPLTVPTERNGYAAVSLYRPMLSSGVDNDNDRSANDPNPPAHALPINVRATRLSAACGHVGPPVRGDVYVGRAHDDEMGGSDWERIDFGVSDADPSSDWCRIASSPGGGGGSGTMSSSSSTHSSLSSMYRTLQASSGLGGSSAPPGVVATTGEQADIVSGPGPDDLFGLNGVPVTESWGTWTQSDEDVELKLAVDSNVTAKQVQITFSRQSVSVIVSGQTLLHGKPFDAIQADDSTYTLQGSTPESRELCVTLAKAQEGRTWSWAVR